MTILTKKGLKENFDSLVYFTYNLHMSEWNEYCKKERKGKQDVEELSMLVSSITSPSPWRMIISIQTFERLAYYMSEYTKKTTNLLNSLTDKLKENEKIVCGDA